LQLSESTLQQQCANAVDAVPEAVSYLVRTGRNVSRGRNRFSWLICRHYWLWVARGKGN